VRHVVETIHRLAGSSSQLAFGAVAQRLGEPEFCCADTTALRALGWSPITQLETGLSRLVSEERQICAF
jgi:CDP-paratose synthetase